MGNGNRDCGCSGADYFMWPFGVLALLAVAFGLLLGMYVRIRGIQDELRQIKVRLGIMDDKAALVSNQQIEAELEQALLEGQAHQSHNTTVIYLIRHAESPYVEGQERTRGLSGPGHEAALKVKAILQQTPVDVFVSSPYDRAIQTIKPLADALQQEIIVVEGLRERTIGDIAALSFKDAKQRVYQDFDYAFAGGESSADAQARGVRELELLMEQYSGQTIVLGTHGDIMTLMLNHYNPQYGYEFWQSTSMPDIYKLKFEGKALVQVSREWE